MPTEIFLILCRYLGINNAHDFFLQMLSSYLKVLLYGGQIELAFSSFASLQCNWRYCLDILQEERRPLVVDYREEEKLSLPMCTNLVLIIEKPTSPKIRTTSGRGISQLTTIIQKAKFASLCVKVFQDQCDLTVPLIEPEEDKFFADDIVEEEPKSRNTFKYSTHRYSKRQSKHDRLLSVHKDKSHYHQTCLINGEVPYSTEYQSNEEKYEDYVESSSEDDNDYGYDDDMGYVY